MADKQVKKKPKKLSNVGTTKRKEVWKFGLEVWFGRPSRTFLGQQNW